MIDLHTHSLLSDGELLPAELSRRMEVKGYKFIAICDHVDYSNIFRVVPDLVRDCEKINTVSKIKVIPGMEITHAPIELIDGLAKEGRRLGAKLVIVHGETIVEPVQKGTNKAALLAGIDILGHPGFIAEEEAKIAARRGIYLEISARHGHSLTNGHVVKAAKKTGAKLVIDSDCHLVSDLVDIEMRKCVGCGAGLSEKEIREIDNETFIFCRRLLKLD
jgi:histidinol phosphatase-like PHP family hydrolase